VQALGFAATWLHLERGDGHVAQECAETEVALSSEHGFPFYLAWGTIHRGQALIAQGQWEEGVAQVRQGLDALERGEVGSTYHLAWLAEGHRGAGQVEDGLAAVAEALRLVDKNDERIYEAELYRVKGELLLTQEGFRLQAEDWREKTEEAEKCFHKAIEIARQQQAKSLELRAVMSLARLWRQQGKQAEARQMLAEIYGWFTEGFDTKDLQEAKTLLDELKEN
jgi:tetratricopeptide (TPR) repeat protein